MCGRYASARGDQELIPLFGVQERLGEALAPSWNIAPTQAVRIVTEELSGSGPVRRMRNARWGLVPSWAKDRSIAARLINARSETFTEKPSFRAAAAKRRCAVPADGYYEWQKTAGAKVPYYLHPEDGSPVVFAGLYELWPDPRAADDDPHRSLWTCTLLTRPATDSLGHIHDRSPVLLPPGAVADWLDPEVTGKADARSMVDALPEPRLVPRRVGPEVGPVRNNHPGLVEPAED